MPETQKPTPFHCLRTDLASRFPERKDVIDGSLAAGSEIRDACKFEGIIASDRRCKKALKIVQAVAFMAWEKKTSPRTWPSWSTRSGGSPRTGPRSPGSSASSPIRWARRRPRSSTRPGKPPTRWACSRRGTARPRLPRPHWRWSSSSRPSRKSGDAHHVGWPTTPGRRKVAGGFFLGTGRRFAAGAPRGVGREKSRRLDWSSSSTGRPSPATWPIPRGTGSRR